MEAQVVTLIVCVALLLLNVFLVLEVRDLKRGGGTSSSWGDRAIDLPDDALPAPPPPERNPHVISRERERIRKDLRERFPKLSDAELGRATEEILTKARETLARIP